MTTLNLVLASIEADPLHFLAGVTLLVLLAGVCALIIYIPLAVYSTVAVAVADKRRTDLNLANQAASRVEAAHAPPVLEVA